MDQNTDKLVVCPIVGTPKQILFVSPGIGGK